MKKTLKQFVFDAKGGDNILLFFQLVQPGRIPSDWYTVAIYVFCVTADSDVYVYDRRKKKLKKKKIKYVTYDDELLCWNFDTGTFALSKPIWIKQLEKVDKYNLLKFSDGSQLKTVNQHRIFNVEKKKFTYPMTDDTPIGTTTFNSSGEYVKLISKEVIEKTTDYCNVITDYNINLFTNDILTSCRLSNIYPIENMKYNYDKKYDNKLDLSKYDKNIINGYRLKEQHMTIKEIDNYMDNLIKNKQ